MTKNGFFAVMVISIINIKQMWSRLAVAASRYGRPAIKSDIALIGVGTFAGTLGSLVGLGGAFIMIPILTGYSQAACFMFRDFSNTQHDFADITYIVHWGCLPTMPLGLRWQQYWPHQQDPSVHTRHMKLKSTNQMPKKQLILQY